MTENKINDTLPGLTPALWLKQYCTKREISWNELADILVVSRSTLWRLQNDETPPDGFQFLWLMEKLHCSNEERASFAQAMSGEIAKKSTNETFKHDAWLAQKIAEKDWTSIAFPALDETWLNGQLLYKQAGLWVKHYRLSKDMTQKTLAQRFGITSSDISDWETGIAPISDDILKQNIEKFPLANDDRFRAVVEKSNIAIAIFHAQQKLQAKAATIDIKMAAKARRIAALPSLDEVLRDQPDKNLARLWFKYYRESRDITQSSFGILLESPTSTVINFEAGRTHALGDNAPIYANKLNMSKEDEAEFLRLVEKSSKAIAAQRRAAAQAELSALLADLPAFDNAALLEKPEYMQAGAWVKERRERIHISASAFAHGINMQPLQLFKCEAGESPIPEMYIDIITDKLHANEEKEFFRELVRKSNAAIIARHAPAPLPPLNINDLPDDKKAGA